MDIKSIASLADNSGGLVRNGKMCFEPEALAEFSEQIADRAIYEALISVSHAVEEEREQCAKTCYEIQMTRFAHDNGDEYHDGRAEGAKECWQAIRKRSNVELRG